LEKEPEQRYQHASEVKTDVQSVTSLAAESKPLRLPNRRLRLPRRVLRKASVTEDAVPREPSIFYLWALLAFAVGWTAPARLWNFGLAGVIVGSWRRLRLGIVSAGS